jgi:hypothetical protein
MKTPPATLTKRCISILLIYLILFYTTGCNYFKVKYISNNDTNSIYDIGNIHKQFIVHFGDIRYSIQSIKVDNTKITGDLYIHKSQIYYYDGRPNRYKSFEKDILHEVHIYLKESFSYPKVGPVEIPLSEIHEIRVIDKNTGATTASYIFSGLGIIVGILAIITIIAALLKSSCPYIYVYDGGSFVFQGETYGGAIASNLARDDYLPLPAIKKTNGTYKIRISNELKEKQYTDLAELMVVNHPGGQNILLDQNGIPHEISNPVLPVHAVSNNGDNLKSALEVTDKEVYLYNDPDYSINAVNLTFERPANVSSGKLILNGKNTLWFDYLFGKFLEKFGVMYDTYMDEQSKILASERYQRAIDNDFPLSIYVKKNGNWDLVEHLFTVGPLASRNFVIPIDLTETYEQKVEVKVETGFMFWELDYAAMSFSENTDYEVNIVKPSIAVGSGSVNWTAELTNPDGQYMAQELTGEVTKVTYKAPPVKNDQMQTVFLHSRGYYELVRDFEGLPELVELNKFKNNGYFSEFSKNEYLNVTAPDRHTASIKQDF